MLRGCLATSASRLVALSEQVFFFAFGCEIVDADVPGVMLRFTEDGKSAFVGRRPVMVLVGCAVLLQPCPAASDADGRSAAERSEKKLGERSCDGCCGATTESDARK